jgi:hypothetical protein
VLKTAFILLKKPVKTWSDLKKGIQDPAKLIEQIASFNRSSLSQKQLIDVWKFTAT